MDNFRADFALQRLYAKQGTFSVSRTLLIECDGHNFHNKYEWQIEYDEDRDRRIMDRFDCSILHLRGFEIHENAYGSAARALDLLDMLAYHESENRRFVGLGYSRDHNETGD